MPALASLEPPRPVAGRTRLRRDPPPRGVARLEPALAPAPLHTAILRTCMDTVAECLDACIGRGGRSAEAGNLRAHLDARDLLEATATLAARDSAYAALLRQTCAEAVERCAASCEACGDGVALRGCADACREAHAHLFG